MTFLNKSNSNIEGIDRRSYSINNNQSKELNVVGYVNSEEQDLDKKIEYIKALFPNLKTFHKSDLKILYNYLLENFINSTDKEFCIEKFTALLLKLNCDEINQIILKHDVKNELNFLKEKMEEAKTNKQKTNDKLESQYIQDFPELPGFINRIDLVSKDFDGSSENLVPINKIQILKSLGDVYLGMGDQLKSIKLFKRLLLILKNKFDKSPGLIASTYMGIGNAYRDKGDFKRANKYYQKSINIATIFKPNENDLNVGMCYSNMGIACYYKGTYEKAIDFYLKSLEIYESVYDFNHPKIASTLMNIGLALNQIGDHEKSIEYFERSLEIKSTYDNNSNIANLLLHIGNSYRELHQYSKAISYYLNSLEMLNKNYSQNIQRISCLLVMIGISFSYLKNYQLALEYYKLAYSIMKTIYKFNNPHIASLLMNMGVAFSYLGKTDESIRLYNLSLIIKRDLYPEDHASIKNVLINLGNAYYDIGDFEKSIQFYEQTSLNMINTATV